MVRVWGSGPKETPGLRRLVERPRRGRGRLESGAGGAQARGRDRGWGFREAWAVGRAGGAQPGRSGRTWARVRAGLRQSPRRARDAPPAREPNNPLAFLHVLLYFSRLFPSFPCLQPFQVSLCKLAALFFLFKDTFCYLTNHGVQIVVTIS